MNYLSYPHTYELIIEKSRFIACLFPVENSTDINTALYQVKKMYPKATHYCSAYILGPNGETGGNNDDGEPSRTAGMPIFEILKRFETTDILCVVVRYFGGIKLGASGLIRAYSSVTKRVLTESSFYQKHSKQLYEIKINYKYNDLITKKLESYGVILNTLFSDIITFHFYPNGSDIHFLDDYLHMIDIIKLNEKVIHVPVSLSF